MFLYETQLTMELADIKPDAKLYELMNHELHGCEDGLSIAMVYLRQSFMIHNETFSEMFRRLSARRLSDMEVLAALLHRLHGEDDRYYDESNDDTPVFEFIPPCKEEQKKEREQHHVNNDLTAAILRDLSQERQFYQRYDALLEKSDDPSVKAVLNALKESSSHILQHLRSTLDILTTHTEQKDFGEGDMHNAWDLDTSNYFDKPNPYFYNPDDKLKL